MTYFEKWQNQLHGYTTLSTFQDLLMRAYQHADGTNRAILAKAYPKYFVEIS